MKKLDFRSQQGRTCHFQAIANVLQYFNCNLAEEDVFLLLRAFYRKDPAINLPYLCKEAFQKIGFHLKVHFFQDEQDLRQKVKNFIDNRIPVILNVHGGVLPYFPATSFYNITRHMVVLTGYMQSSFFVSDVYVPFYPPESFNGYLESPVIYNAIMQGDDEGKIFTLEPGTGSVINATDIFPVAIGNVLEVLIQENAFRCSLLEKTNLDALELDVELLRERVKVTRLYLITNNGPVETRYFLSQLFRKINCLADQTRREEWVRVLTRNYERWLAIANACMKAGIIGDMEAFKRVVRESDKLAREEIVFFRELKAMLAS